jgi:multimeric flavodoxin WrbA
LIYDFFVFSCFRDYFPFWFRLDRGKINEHSFQTGATLMKITTLLGSAKKKGNTATVLGWIHKELESLGHDVDGIYLNNKSVNGCLGCAKCREIPAEIACVQKDDAIDIMERMIASDAVLYASPIYFWGFPAQIKALIDRGYSLVTNYHKPGHTSLMEGKRIGLLVTGADGYDENAEGMFTAFDRVVDFLLARKSGQLYVGGCSLPDSIPDEFKQKALNLAHSLVG